MTKIEFNLALQYLLSQTPPLVLPYGLTPGEVAGGGVPNFTADTWNAYRWNPPGVPNYDGQAVDPAASAKPTWAELQAALPLAQLAEAKNLAIAQIHAFCQNKITANYGVSGLDAEILLRLRDGETAAQNTERDRLRGLFQTQKTAINAATTTAAVKRLLTAALADSFWAPPSD